MLKKLRKILSGRNLAKPRRFIPVVESLEDRRVMSTITDYTQIAQMFPRHEGPTNLYLNFDGWQDKGISAFQATKQSDATADREVCIQDIMFRVSEMYSPFDVQVRRIFGDGVHARSGGHTTIFIGDNSHYNGFGGISNEADAYTRLNTSMLQGLNNAFATFRIATRMTLPLWTPLP